MDRREVLTCLAALAAGPAVAFEPPPEAVRERLPWGKFAKGPHLRAFTAAIAALKGNKEPMDPGSWWFWANIHQSHCPHGKPYFLAWHRGYLWLFERKLREISGVDALRLPYWDYFNAPAIPAEFLPETVDGMPNPLWEPRKGAGIGAALTYAAFDKGLTGFERGSPKAFEPKIESAPHNNIHNLVGGKMATMQSPQDVLFWMHHANVDRLWAAWIAAGQGRKMPREDSAYWDGALDYAGGASVKRRDAIATERLGYRYADLALPRPKPVPEGAAPIPRVRAMPSPPRVGAAPGGNTAPPPPQGRGLLLGEGAVTVNVALPAEEGNRAPPPPPIPRVGAAPGGAPRAAPPPDALPRLDELQVVLEDVTLTDEGVDGGYFYKVYLDLPGIPSAGREERLLGTIGPFQIAAAMHANHGGQHGGVRLILPATELVRGLLRGRSMEGLGQLSVSFVRVDAEGAPAGPVIGIGTFRIERTGG